MKKLLLLGFLMLMACGGGNEDPLLEKPEETFKIASCMVKESDFLVENFSSPIGLYILDENKLPYDPDALVNNASLVHGSWVLNRPVYVTGKGVVYAYYPYSLSDVLPSLGIDMTKQVDILYTKVPATIDIGSSAMALELAHALSQIVVTVEGEEVKSLSLSSSPLSGRFNVCTGQFEVLSNGVVSGSSDKLLVFPHLCSAELKITLLSGVEYTYAIDSQTYVAGENYTYEFKLNANRERLEILSVSVADWINDFYFQDFLK